MTSNEFINKLNNLLGGIPLEEREEILYDYREHFRAGLEEGKTEESIAESLGDVHIIARQFRANYTIHKAETKTSAGNILRAVLATVGLGVFNLVFIFGPFMGVVGILIGLFAAASSISIIGLGIMVSLLISPVYTGVDLNLGFSVFLSALVTCSGIVFFIGDIYLTKFFFKLTVRYLKWNMSLVNKSN